MLALGVVIPVLPKLIESFVGGDTASAALWFGLFGTVWALMQFLFSPLLGALSDRFGRRPVVLLSNFGLGFDYVLMALAPSLGWLFVGRLISGITAASISTAFAYIADVTPPEKRAAAFGMIGAAFGVGFVAGARRRRIARRPRSAPAVLAGRRLQLRQRALRPVRAARSRCRRSGAPVPWRSANPLGALRLLRAHSDLLGFAGVNFLSQLAHVALPSAFVLYAGYRYGWDATMMGLTLALVGVCSLIVQVCADRAGVEEVR